MEKYVEGEWGDFVFRRATSKDTEIIRQLLTENFYPDEQLTNATGGYSKEMDDDFMKMWSFFLDDDLSFIAHEKTSGRVAGVRLNFEHRNDIDWDKFELKSPQTMTMYGCLTSLENVTKICDTYNIDKYADLFITCVHRDFRKRGLVAEMYRRTIALTRDRGYYLAKAAFSSPYSERAAIKLGFKIIVKVQVLDIKDENGVPFIPNAPEDFYMSQGVYIFGDKSLPVSETEG